MVGRAGAYNHDPFYDDDDFGHRARRANTDGGPVWDYTYANDERTLREFARFDADWSSYDPEAPYCFDDDGTTSLVSGSSECSDGDGRVDGQDFASDDEATDEYDDEMSDGDVS